VIVLKRSMRSGFAGIENPLYEMDNCSMLFAMPKPRVEGLTRRRQSALAMHRSHVSTGTPWETAVGYSRAIRHGGHDRRQRNDRSRRRRIRAKRATRWQRSLAAIAELGGNIDDVIRTRIYVVNISDWEAIGPRPRRGFQQSQARRHDGRSIAPYLAGVFGRNRSRRNRWLIVSLVSVARSAESNQRRYAVLFEGLK